MDYIHPATRFKHHQAHHQAYPLLPLLAHEAVLRMLGQARFGGTITAWDLAIAV